MSRIKINIPLHPAYKDELHHIDYFETAVTELVSLNDNLEFKIGKHPVLKASVTKITDDSRGYYSDLRKTWSSLLSFELDIPDVPVDYRNVLSDIFSPEESLVQYQSELILDITIQIFHLFIFSNISKPGAIKASKGKVYLNNDLCGESFPVSSIHRESLDEISKLNWIKYKNLHIRDVMNWFEQNSYSFNRHSNCNTERALNSFTKLFSNQSIDQTFDLFWSLIGIEALLCRSHDGISQQIFEKSQVIFGPLLDYKKKLKSMYNLRSRLIHGDLNFPPENYFEENSEQWDFQGELYDSACLAAAILTGAIQELVINNKKEFNFKYIIEEQK